jgi:small subunit ribosomal protein S4e
MAKMGGDTRVKRQMAPTFWNIRRKESQFVLRVRPGGHAKTKAYPIGIILRDVLKIANTMHEAENIVRAGKVKIDGSIRRDVNFGVGLMDVMELITTGQVFRFVSKDSKLLVPLSINPEEKSKKMIKITSKVVTAGNRLSYGFHDGRTIISDQKMRVGDTCLVESLDNKIIQHVRFETGCMALVTSGENAGSIGKVEDIRDGIFSLPRRALVSFAERSVELPVAIVMAIGSDKPLLQVS